MKNATQSLLVFLFLTFICFNSKAQSNVGIGTVTPSPKSALEIKPNGKQGLLIPRLLAADTSNFGALAATEEGLMFYATDTKKFYYYNSTTNKWLSFGGSAVASAAYTASNGLTLTASNFTLGGTLTANTTIASAGFNLLFPGTGRLGIGLAAAPVQKLDVGGSVNILLDSSYRINNKRMLWAKGNSNIFVGEDAGASVTAGAANTFGGYHSGTTTSSGNYNTFFGYITGSMNTTGSENTMIGSFSGKNSTGDQNTFVGFSAGGANTTGVANTFLGYNAGNLNTSGAFNTIVGYNAGSSTTSSSNVFMGRDAGYSNTSGGNNTFIGYGSGNTNTTGGSNTYIGYNATGSAGLTNSTAIGNNASVTASNSLVLGDLSTQVGIGNTMPSSKLDVTGKVKMTGFQMTTTPTNNYVLTSDATGNGSWKSSAPTLTFLTSINATPLATLSAGVPAKIQDVLPAINKINASSYIEVVFTGHVSTGAGSNATEFIIKIDGLLPINGRSHAVVDFVGADKYQPITIQAIFQNLSVGAHTISIWASSPGGANNVIVNTGNWNDQIIVKEVN